MKLSSRTILLASLTITLLFIVPLLSTTQTSFVSARGPLPSSQQTLYKSGAGYFDIKKITPVSDDENSGGGSGGGGDLPTGDDLINSQTVLNNMLFLYNKNTCETADQDLRGIIQNVQIKSSLLSVLAGLAIKYPSKITLTNIKRVGTNCASGHVQGRAADIGGIDTIAQDVGNYACSLLAQVDGIIRVPNAEGHYPVPTSGGCNIDPADPGSPHHYHLEVN